MVNQGTLFAIRPSLFARRRKRLLAIFLTGCLLVRCKWPEQQQRLLLAKGEQLTAKSDKVYNNCVLRRLFKQLIAIVAGNLLYFFVLMPHLPPAGRHHPDRIDLGLLVDFWVCVVLYGLIVLLDRKWRSDGPATGRRRG
jgi:hypothetical protein